MLHTHQANWLQWKFPQVHQLLKQTRLSGKFALLPTASGVVTMIYTQQEQPAFLHDHTDPREEAERLIKSFQHKEPPEHILFYGVGLGYQIDAFLQAYPRTPFSIYEPDPEALLLLLAARSLEHWDLSLLRHIYTEGHPQDEQRNVQDFIDRTPGKTTCSVLPAYGTLFPKKIKRFMEEFQSRLRFKMSNLSVSRHFQKNWTLNSLQNMHEVWKTPNIFQYKKYFHGKPVVMVAAGPSLEQEVEQLRAIKEAGSAYIVSVGSAINSLLSYGIHPDAACTYDPGEANVQVFEKLIASGISTIPLIFGSTVGARTLTNYPGPKLHLVLAQDAVARYLLKRKHGQPLAGVNDAPSIAVVALQLLMLLGCEQIILVGQDCAYKDNRYYSRGIAYKTELSELEMNTAVTVESVDGKPVRTNPALNRVREELQNYIKANPRVKVINTSADGARIEGAEFQSLSSVMQTYLRPGTVIGQWYEREIDGGAYDSGFLQERCERLKGAKLALSDILQQMALHIGRLESACRGGDGSTVLGTLDVFDELFVQMQRNLFFHIIVLPMNRYHYETLYAQVESVKMESDVLRKAALVSGHYGKFIRECQQDVELVEPDLAKLCELTSGGDCVVPER